MTSNLAMDAAVDVLGRLPDNGLGRSRKAALRALQDTGLPGTQNEDWKYTDLSEAIEISNDWLRAGGKTAPVDAQSIAAVTAGLEVDWLIIRNGEVDLEALAALQRPGLSTTLLSDSEAPRETSNGLASMNLALLRDGIVIRIDPDTDLDRPIGILCIDNAAIARAASQARIVISIGAGGSASFVEYHVSDGDSEHFANSIVELNLEKDANVDYLRIQERHALHSQTGYLRAKLDAGSRLQHGAFDFGGKLVRNDLHIEINGPDAEAHFCGLYLAQDGQHIDNHTRVDHKVGPARSAQEYRGILHGKARCVWNGKAIVHAGADGTDADQANHNLLLTERCEVDTKPELEIYADDVKCSHGTTVGQLDETALFYLRTRGIEEGAARQLLTRAFAETIALQAPIEQLQQRISEGIARKLAGMSSGDAA